MREKFVLGSSGLGTRHVGAGVRVGDDVTRGIGAVAHGSAMRTHHADA
jgi:hypothetical protein